MKYLEYDDNIHKMLYKGIDVDISPELAQDLMSGSINYFMSNEELEEQFEDLYRKYIWIIRNDKIDEILK